MVEQPNLYSGQKGLEELFWFSRPEYRGNIDNVKLLKAAENYALFLSQFPTAVAGSVSETIG